MEYIEIILKNIKIRDLQDVFCGFLFFDKKDIISSHFFDPDKNKEISFQEVQNLKEYFSHPGTCSVYLKEIIMGIKLNNVLIHIACDEKYGDITINFEEDQIKKYKDKEIINEFQKLMTYFVGIYKSGKIGAIILGYEPAEDRDMKIVEMSQNRIEMFNEKNFEMSLLTVIYSIAREINI